MDAPLSAQKRTAPGKLEIMGIIFINIHSRHAEKMLHGSFPFFTFLRSYAILQDSLLYVSLGLCSHIILNHGLFN